MNGLRLALRAIPRSSTASASASTWIRSTPKILAAPAQSQSTSARFNVNVRGYASSAGLNKDDISKRIINVIKDFEKVNASQITPGASFSKDLGLDSLDAVEVVMAIEEEFGIEIPDTEADNIGTVQQAIDYISQPDDL